MEGDRDVISNSRWGTAGVRTGRRVIPSMIIRRHVLSVNFWRLLQGVREGGHT
jgi:hypothetical protein